MGLNHRPADYESAALPLSYAGLIFCDVLFIRFALLFRQSLFQQLRHLAPKDRVLLR